jgi:hypothetical protein
MFSLLSVQPHHISFPWFPSLPPSVRVICHVHFFCWLTCWVSAFRSQVICCSEWLCWRWSQVPLEWYCNCKQWVSLCVCVCVCVCLCVCVSECLLQLFINFSDVWEYNYIMFPCHPSKLSHILLMSPNLHILFSSLTVCKLSIRCRRVEPQGHFILMLRRCSINVWRTVLMIKCKVTIERKVILKKQN